MDGVIVWMGYYDNWDAEIYAWENNEVTRLTSNDFEDRDPRTASGSIVWQVDEGKESLIYLVSPQ